MGKKQLVSLLKIFGLAKRHSEDQLLQFSGVRLITSKGRTQNFSHMHTSTEHVVWQAEVGGETSGCAPLPALVPLSPRCHPLQHGKKIPRCKAQIQPYHSRMTHAGKVPALWGPEEEREEDITFQRVSPLQSHSKGELCFGFSPASPSDNF